MTPEQIAADSYNRAFSVANPQIPFDAKKEPVGYMNYLKGMLSDQAARGGNSYKDPAIPTPTAALPTIIPQFSGELPVDWAELNAAIASLHAEVAKIQVAITTQLTQLNAFVAAELSKIK